MKTIALIEDDPDLQELLRYNLEREGYSFAGSKTGENAVEFLLGVRPDLIVLDIMLPGVDGLEICKKVRANPRLSAVPIIFLTAKASEADRVIGLELGGNDYMVKPFFIRELIARIKLQFRTREQEPDRITGGSIELDRDRLEDRRDGEMVALTATEFRLLEYLMARPGRVFSRNQLLDQVWGGNHAVSDRTVDVCVLRLRQKLEIDPSAPRWIHSVRGFGYTFDPDRKN
jgi:DNA-binding response OmpR family regulator